VLPLHLVIRSFQLPYGFRMLDDILEGPDGHVWKQAIEYRTGSARTVELEGNSYMWVPIRPPNIVDDKKRRMGEGRGG